MPSCHFSCVLRESLAILGLSLPHSPKPKRPALEKFPDYLSLTLWVSAWLTPPSSAESPFLSGYDAPWVSVLGGAYGLGKGEQMAVGTEGDMSFASC